MTDSVTGRDEMRVVWREKPVWRFDEPVRKITPTKEEAMSLNYSQQAHIVARCPTAGKIKLGGLGALGVGQMWFNEKPEHAKYPGCAEAEIVSDDQVEEW